MRRATPTTGERADHLEQVKKSTKHVNECVRRANAVLGEAGSVGAVFGAGAVGVRARLREACERVILLGPGAHARRTEELLWRKVYYDPLTVAKKMRKGSSWSITEAFWVHHHLWSGLAFYHQLLHTLAPLHPFTADLLPPPTLEDEEVVKSDGAEERDESVVRCLTCLGDLARYMLDLPSPPPPHLPVRYYLQALQYQAEGGLIHSNLATVYTSTNQPLLAAAHYLRALVCDKSFEGAEGNLRRLLDKSRAVYESEVEEGEAGDGNRAIYHHKRLLHTFLTLLSYLVTNRATEEVARLCQEVLVQLGKVLESSDEVDSEPPDPAPSPQKGLTPTLTQDQAAPFLLNPEAMVALCAVLSLCAARLKKQGSSHTSMAQALLVSVLMTLVSHVSTRLEQRISMVDPAFLANLYPNSDKKEEENGKDSMAVPQKEDKNMSAGCENGKTRPANPKKSFRSSRLARLRRRRRVNSYGSNASEEDHHVSGGSESDEETEVAKECEQDSDISEDEDEEEEEEEELDLSQLCSSEDDDSDEDVKVESEQEWEGLSAGEHLELVGQEGLLVAVVVAWHWLLHHPPVLSLCLKTGDSLWTAMAKLLNLVHLNLPQLRNNSHGVRHELVDLLIKSQHEAAVKIQNESVENDKESVGKEEKESAEKKDGEKTEKGQQDSAEKKQQKTAEKDQQGSTKNEDQQKLAKIQQELGKNVGQEPGGEGVGVVDPLVCALHATPLLEDQMLHTLLPSWQPPTCTALNLRNAEMVLVRVERLGQLGQRMAVRQDTPLWRNPDTGLYHYSMDQVVALESATPTRQPHHTVRGGGMGAHEGSSSPMEEDEDQEVDPLLVPARRDSRRLAGMQSLTAQWLQHEVRNLEERTARRATLGLYLVPDAAVLVSHLPALKLLLARPTHMIIIPQTVIDLLDQQKRESLGARDAIRWLEVKFRHGSRFIRSQRPHERTHLPLIKYPKRKDKEAWEWYQIVECCHYLSAQVQQSSSQMRSATVTLLTGQPQPLPNATFSPSGLASTAGAILEHIEEFMRKWQTSTKGHS